MGETKEVLSRPIWLTRIILASVVSLVAIIALCQIIFFNSITIRFNTGVEAQQIPEIRIKKGTSTELPTPLKPGSYFVGWSTSKDGGEPISDLKNLTKDTTLYAVWDGLEKYGVLMVDGVVYDNVNIFLPGISATVLNEKWVLPDDFTNGERKIIYENNYQRFLGWEYLNQDGEINQLLYDNGTWTLRTAAGEETEITDTNLFYPPNHRTAFNAILEYRKFEFRFLNYGDSTESIASSLSGMAGDYISAPQYAVRETTATLKFSHWEIEAGNLMRYTAETIQVPTFMPGETIKIDPLWYYLGNKNQIFMDNKTDDTIVLLTFRATEWETQSDKYTMQIVSDVESGSQRTSIVTIAPNELSLTQPVAYYGNSLYFYKDPTQQISSYSFVDHNGNACEIFTDNFDTNQQYLEIKLAGSSVVAGEEVSFNSSRAINIIVNFKSAKKDIAVKFNFGEDIYILPDYTYSAGDYVASLSGQHIGDVIRLQNAEKYIKNDFLFFGWQIKGDTTGKVYYAGEIFTIPNMSADTLEFVAVWRESRLLFDFDFNGGGWEQTPDFRIMKGSYGNWVQIVQDIPVKFGYNFVGWEFKGETLQPEDYLMVGSEIQTLHALWAPKKLQITYSYLIDSNGNRVSIRDTGVVDGIIELRQASTNDCYFFDGWQIGETVYQIGERLTLDAATVAKLNPVPDGEQLKIEIVAKQTRRYAEIKYYISIDDSNNNYQEITRTGWTTAITQGEKFYNSAPFSLDHEELDMFGKEFIGWEFCVGWEPNNTPKTKVEGSTIIPSGAERISVCVTYETKKFTIEYRGFEGELYRSETVIKYYNDDIDLPETDGKPVVANNSYGSFVGWSFEKDYLTGNPDIIYIVLGKYNPKLKLGDTDDMLSTPYLTAIDKHAVKIDDNYNYRLTLYAVYAQDLVRITYQGLESYNSPIFVGSERTISMVGGTTVGPDQSDYDKYGIMVRDEYGLTIPDGQSFVGWELRSLENVKESLRNQLANKLWFPGEMLPAVDFDLTFFPVFVKQDTQSVITVGTTHYRVACLGEVSTHYFKDIDILVLSKGDYTVHSNAITVDGELTRVVVSANGKIVLEPMAIRATKLASFYVSDELVISGSPVVSTNLQSYQVKKGYITCDSERVVLQDYQDQTTKYNFAASLKGLLVEGQTLLAVPSNTIMSTADLRASLNEFNINHIAGYALAEMNSLTQIDLAIDDLQIDARAIFTSTASTILLPLSANNVSAECISGYQPKLTSVKFGTSNSKSNYAFVEGGVLYYGTTKNQIIYVLSTITTREITCAIDFKLRDLLIDPAVTIINDYALSSLNWSLINSVTADAENQNIDLAKLVGVPTNIPLFVNKKNDYLGGMMQTYAKTFVFAYTEGGSKRSVEIVFNYGEYLEIPDAEANSTIGFKKEFYKFIGWSSGDNFYRVGEIYRIGVDIPVVDEITLDADKSQSWRAYPVQFNIYDAASGTGIPTELNITSFINDYGLSYTIEDIMNNESILAQLYLPGVDLVITRAGTKYQFVGWTAENLTGKNFDNWLWNNTASDKRFFPTLPDGTTNTKLNVGTKTNGAYVYYALYDLVTDNLEYTYENNTFTVRQNANANDTNVYIPYAKAYEFTRNNQYLGCYMVPVMKVADNAFSGNQQITGRVVIGAAVSEIGNYAFNNVQAKIEFAHIGTGLSIGINNRIYLLSIGNFAFSNNKVIETFTLPGVVQSIGDNAFAGCSKLGYFYREELEGNAKPMLNKLGDFVFMDDTIMSSNAVMTLITAGHEFNSIGVGVFKNTKLSGEVIWNNTLLYAGGMSGAVEVTTNIAGYAFASISGITSITITNANANIEAYAFAEMSSLVTRIDLSKCNINRVDVNAFAGMTVNPSLTIKVAGALSTWQTKFKGLNFTSN